MLNLKEKRIRRSRKTRNKISELGIIRLSVHRTNSHIYAQLIDKDNNKIITSASTLEPEVRKEIISGGNVSAGYKYHGRVRALADAAREHGLNF